MPRTYSSLAIHVVFGTWRHERAIGPDIRIPLHKYLYGIARNIDCRMLAIGGVADHVHLLVEIPTRLSVADLVRTLNSNSSTWASERKGHRFRWQSGYGAFAVSRSVVPRVVRYIQTQEEHHRRMSYREEVERFLRESGLTVDPRYFEDD